MSGSRTTLAGRLARLGFADAARAERLLLTDLGIDPDQEAGEPGADPLLTALAAAADPDLALTGLARVFGATDDRAALRQGLRDEPDFRDRLTAVLGVSAGLADHLARHPQDVQILRGPIGRPGPAELREQMLLAVGANPRLAEPAAGHQPAEPVAALAAAYRRRLLHLAARDMTAVVSVEEVVEELADIAAAVLEAALAVARSELVPGSAPCRLAVVAMGKCGARELNYASDVDVIFVAEPTGNGVGDETAALTTASRLAAGLIGVCARSTPEGSIFPVDPNLRPEGRQGPLVRTLASHRAYYERWAKTWEFQALLKARPVAGDMALGQAYSDTFAPLVWQAARREHFVEDTQAMRRRVEQLLPPRQAGRELKLGPGGLRDIEFAVQLLQLVHGRTDETLRAPATLPALAALAAGGYVGRADADELTAAYRFLRRTEHLLQLHRLSRTHTLPEDPAVLRRLGRAMRSFDLPNGPWYPPPATSRSDPAVEFDAMWRLHARQVRRLHEKLFYRPLLDAVASLPGEAARLTPQAAEARLKALGYADPAGALRHIGALTAGVSRRAAIQRTLLPLLLGWFAGAADPDAGLLAFHQVSDALGNTPWYLRLLRDDMTVAQRMARLLASSRYAAGLLLRQPETVAWLGNDTQLAPRDRAALHAEATALVGRHGQAADAVAAVRALRCRELLRTAMADLLGRSGPEQTGEALTVVAAVTIEAALQVALRSVTDRLGDFPTRLCVVAMGRFGGHECGYGSDADVMFVHDPLPGAGEQEATAAAHAAAEELRALLSKPGTEPPLLIDPGLRPEGRQGPLVRTLASYRA
ncbi:MAG TPA: bifunctional [glutamine synthetase] adenylyltransferase/[glutamine synthetase]-adenylyl-L-tyrosine phosphorylase, partial [Streptosporangiaceae bacterium]|nr:bifunctional [glutamine synthetase] adenylyltransferase/[glutamine synthetase]-adenylyl-L-tyrosine phosphorylase [Streptosporangiaceae bacterium]